MAKKLIDIENKIESEAIPFKRHLINTLDKGVLDFIDQLNTHYKVYIFSGIIRNYFLKISEYRDVDIVIDGTTDIEKFINKYRYKKNSFGGYKIKINNINVDLWFLKDTLALKDKQGIFDFELPVFIAKSSFFNFAAIMFSYDETKFYSSIYFKRFLRDKKIDIANPENANESLCVVNSLYYSDKLKLELTEKLKKHIKHLYENNVDKYKETQLKHFGKVLFTDDVIEKRISSL